MKRQTHLHPYPKHPTQILFNRMPHRPFTYVSLLLGLLLLLLPVSNSFAAEQDGMEPAGKMVFLPFTIQTAKPQQYLQSGLTNILSTRMTNRTGLVAIQATDKTSQLTGFLQTGNDKAFKETLKKMNGDYLIMGSLEQQTTDFEIMIYVFSHKKSAPASFIKTITTLDQAIPAMDELSIDIAEKVFNKKRPDQLISADQRDDGISGFQTAHPDRAFREGLYQPATILGLDNNQFNVMSSRRSRKIAAPVRALDIGDLDGDGQQEIVILEKKNLAIYRFRDDHFQHVTDNSVPSHLGVHAVNLADLDNNGFQEIYVSANNGDQPSSQVYEWDGKAVKTLYKDVPYYLRPGVDANGKPILLAQAGSNTDLAGTSFYRLQRDETGTLAKADTVQVPKGFNLFDFIRVDLEQDGTLEFVGITRNNKLIVLDAAGKALWKSEAGYGASKEFLGTLSSNKSRDKLVHMHTRLIARDQDGDGKPEIIIGRNRLTTVKFINRLRYFEGSSINALKWENGQMTTLWETRKIPGYTTDYQVVYKDGQPNQIQLFFMENDNSYPFFFWESEESVIHLYEMGRKTEQENVGQ